MGGSSTPNRAETAGKVEEEEEDNEEEEFVRWCRRPSEVRCSFYFQAVTDLKDVH